MRRLHLPRTIALLVVLSVAAAIPTATTTAQSLWRPACDLLPEAGVSEALGAEAIAQRSGTRQMCTYLDVDGGQLALLWLQSDVDLSLLAAQEGSEPITIAGVEGVTTPFGQPGRLVLGLPDGGLLDMTVTIPDADPDRQLAAATSLAEAIIATGPVTAIPTDRGDVAELFVVSTMCDALPVEQVNTITGGRYVLPDYEQSSDESCIYVVPDGFESVSFNFGSGVADAVDAGTYTSEELTIAERPAVWDPEFGFLTVDAGGDRTLHVNFLDAELDPARRDHTAAIAEALIPNLTGAAPPPPPPDATCDASLTDLSRITGLEITSGSAFGPVCFYTAEAGTTMSGVLAGFLPGDDPAAALEAAEFTSEVEPTAGDVDGRPALLAQAPEGTSIAVDLDGLPGGDGQVLVVAVGGLPEGSDQLAVATEVVRFLISQM
jgi:hypothetical protein